MRSETSFPRLGSAPSVHGPVFPVSWCTGGFPAAIESRLRLLLSCEKRIGKRFGGRVLVFNTPPANGMACCCTVEPDGRDRPQRRLPRGAATGLGLREAAPSFPPGSGTRTACDVHTRPTYTPAGSPLRCASFDLRAASHRAMSVVAPPPAIRASAHDWIVISASSGKPGYSVWGSAPIAMPSSSVPEPRSCDLDCGFRSARTQ